MTENQRLALAGLMLVIVIVLFMYSNKQKRAHEDKMAQLRRDRKAMVEQAKRERAKSDSD